MIKCKDRLELQTKQILNESVSTMQLIYFHCACGFGLFFKLMHRES